MARIVISEFMADPAVDRLRTEFDVLYEPDLFDNVASLRDAVSGADALIVRNLTKVDLQLLSTSPKLRCVGRLGVGLDNIDQNACNKASVEVFVATGANETSVVEYVLTTTLMLMRRSFQFRDKMLNGSWPRQESSGREIAGKTLGLVGLGRIARKTAMAAMAMDMKITAFDPFLPTDDNAWNNIEVAELDRLLETSDVVSLHTPLNSDTRHLINDERLARMKQGAILINSARGGVVDERALVAAVRSGHLAGAALDVFETEPLSRSAVSKFDDLDNVILTPHIAGVTKDANLRVSDVIADQISACLRQPAHPAK